MSEVKTGFECGIGFEKFNDLKVGDVIEVFAMERVLSPRDAMPECGKAEWHECAIPACTSDSAFELSTCLMSQGSRPDRVADQIRSELAHAARARGPRSRHRLRDAHARAVSARPAARRACSTRRSATTRRAQNSRPRARARGAVSAPPDRLAAAPEARRPSSKFIYDESIAGQDRIEQILNEIRTRTPRRDRRRRPRSTIDDQS